MSIVENLKAPFPPEKIHWRVGATNGDKTKGMALAYIDARDVMDRLDVICGPENWQCEYPFAGCCKIGIKIEDRWVWKSNGAGQTDVEGEKGQFSDAFKRAGVMWGIGRYLYGLGNTWVAIKPQGRSYVIAETPKLPAWALPGKNEKSYAEEVSARAEQALEEELKEAELKESDVFQGKLGYIQELCKKTNTEIATVTSFIRQNPAALHKSIASLEAKL